MKNRTPSARSTQSAPQVAAAATDRELASAERRGAARVRALLRDLLDDRRRIVRLGEHQIEVVEVSALDELLADEE